MAAAALCVAALPLAACSNSGSGSSGGDQSRFVSGDGTAVLLAESDRVPAPNINGTTLAGKPFSLEAERGKVVALNVWASWCAPCRTEAPALEQLYKELGPKGVQLVGLDTRDTKAAADAFVRRFEISYPNIEDPNGQQQLEFRGTLPPQAIPSTVIVDRQGRVAGRILGPADRAVLRQMLSTLAAEPGNA